MDRAPQDFEHKLKEALKQGFPIDYKGKYNGRCDGPLLCRFLEYNPCIRSRCEVLYTLLDNGADPNVGDIFGSLPLHTAVCLHRPGRAIKRLILAGADVNGEDDDGSTAFYWAAWDFIYNADERIRGYSWRTAKLLLDAGADPYLCRDWLEEFGADTPGDCARRRKIKALCEAYLVKRSVARMQDGVRFERV